MKKLILPIALLFAVSCTSETKEVEKTTVITTPADATTTTTTTTTNGGDGVATPTTATTETTVTTPNQSGTENAANDQEQYTIQAYKKKLGNKVSYEGTYTSKGFTPVQLLYVNDGKDNKIIVFKNDLIESEYKQKEAWAKGGLYVDESLNELKAEGDKVTIKLKGNKESTVYTEKK